MWTKIVFLVTGLLGSQAFELGNSVRAAPGPDCWFEDMCKVTGDVIVASVADTADAVACYEECVANADCLFFTWSVFFNGKTRCDLLASCDETEQCSGPPENCASGPTDCAIVNPCTMLTYTKGDAVWSCPNNLNPYKEEIPDGYTCTTSCGGWYGSEGTQIISASSTCVNGAWETPTTSPVLTGAETVDAAIETPNLAPKCECRPFELWYNPNDELGADFWCTISEFSTASEETPVTLDPTEECLLMCDNYIVADIMCANGEWTDADPELGVACYKAPPARGTTPATPAPTLKTPSQ